jgi:PAS domain S-box-containing protein
VKPGIQTKTILAFLIIAAISIFSTSIISIRQARSSLSEDLAVHFEEMAAEQYSSVARVIENGIQDCSLLAGNPIVASNAPPEVIRAELQAKQEILRDYEDITLLNPQGEVVTSTGNDLRGPWEYRAAFEEALAGRPAVSDVYDTSDPARTVITFTAPVFDPQGGVKAVIATQLNMNQIWEITDQMKVGETGYVYIIDEFDRYIAHPDKGLILHAADPQVLEQMNEGVQLLDYQDADGREMVGEYYQESEPVTVEGAQVPAWKVVVVQEGQEVFRLINRMQMRIVTFSIIVFLVVILIGLWFSSTLTRPIRLLTRGAEAIGRGDFDSRVEVKSKDEIGSLASTFNLMADAVSGDIAARQQAAQALSESEELYRRLVETSPDAITLTDMQANVVVANQQAAAIFGFASPEQMVGENFFAYVVEEDLERAHRVYREQPVDGIARNVEYLMWRRDGTIFPGEVSASMVLDSEMRPRGFIGIVRDITERKAVEEALRTSEEKYRAIFEATGTAVCMLDAEGIISFANQEFAGITGYAMQSLEGKKQLSVLILKEDRHAFERNLANAMRGPAQVPMRFPLRLYRRSGEEVHTLGNMARIPGTDTVVISLVDVTRERVYERTLEERTQQLRDFLSIASHELRHPITLIKGYLELLAEELEDNASPSVLLSLKRVQTSTNRLTLLGDELMDASRIEQDSFTLFKTAMRLEDLARQAMRELELRGIDNTFTLRVLNQCGAVEVDREKIYRLLVILLENAAKFSPPQGLVEVELEAHHGEQVVSVLDRGIGIPDGERMKIFDRFYQVEDVLHHSIGLGLGLYIATEIVEVHGGRIWCNSREDGGSVFSFSVPL